MVKKKKDKWTNNNLQNTTHKTKDGVTGIPLSYYLRLVVTQFFLSHNVSSVPHDHDYLFAYILTFGKEPIEQVILISCNIAVLYARIVVQLSLLSLAKRLNKRCTAENI